jgi:hypothetical protein
MVGLVQKIGKLDRAKAFSKRYCLKNNGSEYAD